ncbi:hypothetical protein DdX_17574 [Ditylenchus destructor]|uniref:Uncharacterized protein n=1 Tax=Ditylenchus destructor TaxID=166010 RepID=A0AAD4MRQ8_9BILA|nr:hypothetical protein DdX_17574 [Ditylenchus destructor]
MNGMSEIEHFPQHSLDSEVGPLVRKSDVWSPLGYDTKIDVFKFLRPYDIRKFCVYVNKSWAFFCVENQRYIPRPRSGPRRTVDERYCIDENQAFGQRIIDDYTHKLFLSCLTFSTILLATWSCIVYLIVRINNQSEENPTDDLLALCPFMVLSLVKTYRCVKDVVKTGRCVKDCCYYDNMKHKQRRHWLIWLCFRLILVLAALSFTYLFPHLTPSTSALWIAVTVTHIPECRKFFSWMNWTSSELCLVYYNSHGPNCKCLVIQGMFTILTFSVKSYGQFMKMVQGKNTIPNKPEDDHEATPMEDDRDTNNPEADGNDNAQSQESPTNLIRKTSIS